VTATRDAAQGRSRNAQATRGQLLAAARQEFSEYGSAGARIDRIAQRSGVNKRMIYVYFGDKDRLLEAVIERQIAELSEALPLAGDLTAFAAARFDYMLAHPQVRRLAGWRTFERAAATAAELDSYRDWVEAVAAAQDRGTVTDAIPAVDLLAMVLRLTESWLTAPPGLRAASDDDPVSARRLARHRSALIEAVRRITDPG